ncbi:hypothetical protein OY671_009275, partial [Metschnikowia pulcherrima]
PPPASGDGQYAGARPARAGEWGGWAIPAVSTPAAAGGAEGFPASTDDGGPRRQPELAETVAYDPGVAAPAADSASLDDDDDSPLPLPRQLDPPMQRPEHAQRLDESAAKKGVSKSSIVAAALASWSSPDAADQREAAIAKRLDRSSRQAERMERDQNIAIETSALFIRYYSTVSTPVPEAHQDAARAQGKAR